jgi:hypothetical protein
MENQNLYIQSEGVYIFVQNLQETNLNDDITWRPQVTESVVNKPSLLTPSKIWFKHWKDIRDVLQ